jgi:integrase/recombinase XerD
VTVTVETGPPTAISAHVGLETGRVAGLRHNGNSRALLRVVPTPDATAVRVVEDYLAGYFGHTQAAYRRDLGCFFTYCHRADLAPLQAQRCDITGYLHHLREHDRSASTIARRLVALRGFYDLAVADYGLPKSPMARIRFRRPRTQSRIGSLSFAELHAFLTAADQAKPRTTGLAWLLATTGLRISEACTSRIDDITVSANAGERWLHVLCKGNVTRSVPVHHQAWLRLASLAAGTSTGPLFATRTGNCVDRKAASRDLIRLATAAGITDPFSPHVLRHTFISLARQSSCALEDVQEAVGHTDPATTRAYDRTLTTHSGHPAHRILTHLTTQAPAPADTLPLPVLETGHRW